MPDSRRNVLGLVSGNLKRHLIARHGAGQLVFELFGDQALSKFADPRCATCQRHLELLK